MFKKIINFIKYHNAFTIGLILVFVVSLTVMANEDIRDAVVGQEIVTEIGIDNFQILSNDLDNFNLSLQIQNVSEDNKNYYIPYTYQTLAIKDNGWQIVTKEKTLTISKKALANQDLGLYVTEELLEVANYELSYLKEVQEIEKEKGLQKLVASIEYTGLKGLVLDVKNKIFPEYEPILQPLEPELEIIQELVVQESIQQPIIQESIDREMIREIVQKLLAQEQIQPSTVEPALVEELTCQPTEEICDQIDNNCDGQIDEGSVCESQPAENILPVADDQNLSADTNTPIDITLIASDVDGDTLTYFLVSQPTNGILSGEAPNLTYISNTDYTGQDSFTFTVNDGITDSNIATITITVSSVSEPIVNDQPIADAGQDQTVEDINGDGVEQVTLNGSASSDHDGQIVSFEWKEGENILGTEVIITYDFLVGTHTVLLTVTDDAGLTASDEVIITANPKPNQAPIAAFTADKTEVLVGDTVNFDASGSTDPDSTIASYQWNFGDGITGTGVIVFHAFAATEAYTVTLTVTDEGALTATATIIITISDTTSTEE